VTDIDAKSFAPDEIAEDREAVHSLFDHSDGADPDSGKSPQFTAAVRSFSKDPVLRLVDPQARFPFARKARELSGPTRMLP